MRSRLPYVITAAAASAWLIALVVAAYLASHFPHNTASLYAGGSVYRFASLLCHQRPERSFHLSGVQLPVCARCLGLYASAAAGAWLGFLTLGRASWRAALIIAAVPTAASVALEAAGVWQQTPLVRFVAAFPLGFVTGWFVASHAGQVVMACKEEILR